MNATTMRSKPGFTALDEVRSEKLRSFHQERLAVAYVRQSTAQQVLDHQESTRLQYGLVNRAQALGWEASRILVIDDDLGKSGASTQGRVGFQRLVSEVSLDHVGIIFGVEMSRLARSNKDWHQLLELCALFHTLIADLDGIYDPALYNDRLLLGLKGTMSEAELYILKQRMYQGRLSKAQRGDLQFALPVGYVWSPVGEIQFDPYEQVQQVVRFLFRKFDELGTLGGLVRYLGHHQIQLGIRVREGPGKGELVWRRPNRATIQMMLKHPLYAGSYVYGRRQEDPRRKQGERPRAGRVVVPQENWLVLLPDRCPAYISPEQYERNQERLQANRARADAMGAARGGAALLAGLAVCARCGCRLTVHYDGGGPLHTYACVDRYTHYGEPRCQHLAGPCLDRFVSEQVLAALEPAALELSLAATEQMEQERAELDQLWQHRRERAAYEAERAARQYHAVEPEHRLVARTLERAWEEKLLAQQQLEEEYHRFLHQKLRLLSESEREAIRRLATDIPAIWAAPTTTDADRKEILRPVILGWETPKERAAITGMAQRTIYYRDALMLFMKTHRDRAVQVASAEQQGQLTRLIRPLQDTLAVMEGEERLKINTLHLYLRMCARDGRSFWAWEYETWLKVLSTSQADFFTMHKPGNPMDLRQYVIAVAYLLDCFSDLQALGGIEVTALAYKVFGRTRVEATVAPILEANAQWGYSRKDDDAAFRSVIAEALLLNKTPLASELTRPFLVHMHTNLVFIPRHRAMVYRLSRILVHLGLLESPLPLLGGLPATMYKEERKRGTAPEWVEWVERWFATTTHPPQQRRGMRLDLLRLGRWLAQHHPEVTTPVGFTRELAAEVVAAVNQMSIGDFSCENLNVPLKHPGKPWSATRKHGFLGVLRRFFNDTQDWGWMERLFNPQRVFATPRHLKHQMRVAPRTVSDDLWAKLLWAGLNLRAEDCPLRGHHCTRRWTNKADRKQPAPADFESYYPLEMIRALAIVWLFAGLRSDEISRLRVGCARMQTVVGDNEDASIKPVCLLDIPVHKTGRAFTKPVDPLVGEAIAAWEAVRPAQPDLLDPKTGEQVQFLFCCRAKRLSKTYLNHTLIPTLCERAGIPRTDARGSISSHRARSTIASQLFNVREPMTLFELQTWLGHQSPATTQHYVSTSPTKLAQAYKDAGYFSRNVRAIEVLVDQDAIMSGAAANGSPWRYYDLGHGWCSYEFFDQCPHRMACARCDFYVQKDSTRGLWLDAREGLLKMLQEIPLSDEERAAVDGDVQALDQLLQRLATVPTPSVARTAQATTTFIPLNRVSSR